MLRKPLQQQKNILFCNSFFVLKNMSEKNLGKTLALTKNHRQKRSLKNFEKMKKKNSKKQICKKKIENKILGKKKPQKEKTKEKKPLKK